MGEQSVLYVLLRVRHRAYQVLVQKKIERLRKVNGVYQVVVAGHLARPLGTFASTAKRLVPTMSYAGRKATTPKDKEVPDFVGWFERESGMSITDRRIQTALQRARDIEETDVLEAEERLNNGDSESLRLAVRRAKSAGQPFPRSQEIARAEFGNTLHITTDLGWDFIAALAWHFRLLPTEPRTRNQVCAFEQLCRRHW